MTLDEIAAENKESLEAFFGRCWKWWTRRKFAPITRIRADLIHWNTQGEVPAYVDEYLKLLINGVQGHA